MITSPDNPKLKLARRLHERPAREREGLFLSEGEDLLAAGLGAGWEPRTVLVKPGSGLAGEEVEPALLDRYAALGSGTRAIAIWELPETGHEQVGRAQGPCVFCDGIGDPGNVGAIVRSAAALGGARLVAGEGTADPWGPRAVRASMGSCFAIPPARAGVGSTPAPRVGLAAHGGSPLTALDDLGPATLCLGSERDGLSAEASAACELEVTIALPGTAESLNVAAAAAIVLHRLSSLGSGGWDGGEPE